MDRAGNAARVEFGASLVFDLTRARLPFQPQASNTSALGALVRSQAA